MQINDIVNIIAIILSPIVAVIVGQILQNRDKRRNDKMEIFKTLMIGRGLGWSVESVKALNIIYVVFSDDKKVLDQWKIYYDKLCIENPTEMDLLKIKIEGDKLLDIMSRTLGYKDKVTWEIIQKPYIPMGMTENMLYHKQYMNTQMETINMINSYMQQMK